MATTTHTIQVTLERRGEAGPIDGGVIVVEGKDYDTFDDNAALTAILPGGDAPYQLDLSIDGYVRWRNTIMPASEFLSLQATIIAKSRPSQKA